MLIIFPPQIVNEMTDLLLNYALKFPVDAVLPAAAEAAGQWVVKQWTPPPPLLLLLLSSQPTSQPISRHWSRAQQPVYGTLRTSSGCPEPRTQDTHWFTHRLHLFYRFNFFFFYMFVQRNFFELCLRWETFTYGSRIWGQVVVSLRETSLCCCCCKVRFIISFNVRLSGKVQF